MKPFFVQRKKFGSCCFKKKEKYDNDDDDDDDGDDVGGGGGKVGKGGRGRGRGKGGGGNGRWREYSIVACVAFICYLNAFFGDFVHDDIPAITRNRDVTGQTPILQVLKNDFWGTAMSDPSSHKSYRPLTTFSFSKIDRK
ncbi:smile protein, putative [Pediculus humanus corporis]|uniref:Smile protein, putative n=1 Tax=Pediculus humanus subsp. corporis TaxID=121224 RepID=E0VKZ7_PEDHC|nr:smile protein, putative [Pediculus humanus corporis]EEB14053.1 smile protein, putative [Pediculus humanus corporis]